MDLTSETMWNAVLQNDPSYDGVFFYGVRSTGIYCRPSCASRPPLRQNTLFFASAKEAEAAGYRPCKRCRPDLAVFAPDAELAGRAKAIIEQRFAEGPALPAQLGELGVTRRHLTELFERAYDTTPEQYLAQVRLGRAKQLLAGSRRVTEVAFAVGMGSVSAFSAFFKKQTGVSPARYAARSALPPAPAAACRVLASPLGLSRVTAGERGITSLRFAENGALPEGPEKQLTSAEHWLDEAGRQLREYFQGIRREFTLPLAPHGSPFQCRVWEALRAIPYGETRSYQQVAEAVGSQKAARAVGMANNRNPIAILIPCHRVVGKGGALVGYAYGIARKEALLALEQGEARQIP